MLLCEGDENEDPGQRTQGEEDTSEKGSDKTGNGRKYARWSHPERLGPLKRGVKKGGSKGEVPGEGEPRGTNTGWTGGRPQKAEAQIDQKRSVERADVANGQGKTGSGAPREPERDQAPPRRNLNQTP